MTETKIPTSLARPPIVEALFELRFSSDQGFVGDLLPGLLYAEVKDRFNKTEQLPIVNLPREVRRSDPNLRYVPHMKLAGNGESIMIGDHVVTVSKVYPYLGWAHFRQLCETVLRGVENTQLVQSVERFSYKCVNIIELPGKDPLTPFNASVQLGTFEIPNHGFRVRAEIPLNNFTNIVEIAATASVDVAGLNQSGALFSIDTFCDSPKSSAEFWSDSLGNVDAAHQTEKELFFGLLGNEAVETYGPIWS